ncbi:hypothetical protein [Ulvibacter litoralis]|uniref:Uncharacterized protein n=1 Tax=Ulvibacter litoralis TaxID=227084 RepID=A0A1G7CN13_9FLAO|nr:hypothetical protein [Ulvibacter litoralis]GHC46763.1 hypothetical protein GCM10008083_07290 [Ulvibacter litoralis]SDE40738.1 hypothetical protein SAMN05421855_101468 [Ulvibacter litoralis]
MQIGNMTEKARKFQSLFKHKSFAQLLNTSGSLEELYNTLTEDDVNDLFDINVIFIRSSSPSSKIELDEVNISGSLVLINFDANQFKLLLPKEVLAIILHEIGHVFNPEIKDMEGEYVADAFVKSKGYGKWIISSLEKGVKNKWLGFDKIECDLRIQKLKE